MDFLEKDSGKANKSIKGTFDNLPVISASENGDSDTNVLPDISSHQHDSSEPVTELEINDELILPEITIQQSSLPENVPLKEAKVLSLQKENDENSNEIIYANELEELEIDIFIEAIKRYYGLNLKNYLLSTLKKKILNMVSFEGLNSITGLLEKILHNENSLKRFVFSVSLNVTTMFYEPAFYLALRKNVIPVLRELSFIRIWITGCSTGEEVYSMAILLQEEGLFKKCKIYATDTNETSLKKAKTGIYPLQLMREYTTNYLKSGGREVFSEYYTSGYDSVLFKPFLKKNIIFSCHDFSFDGVFNDFDLIICRDIMYYFNSQIQKKAWK